MPGNAVDIGSNPIMYTKKKLMDFNDLKIGCKIKTTSKHWNNIVGTVIEIDDWSKVNGKPLTNENHGSFTILVEEPGNCNYLNVGDEEHFSYFNWRDFCEII